MASGMDQNESKSKSPTATLLGDVVSHAHRKLARRTNGVQHIPMGRRILNVLRNLAWVVPLTILVWLYAERESIDDKQRLSVPITIVCQRRDRMATIVSPQDKTIVVGVEGTRVRIEQARQDLVNRQGIQITVPADTEVGSSVSFPVLEHIAASDIFANRGIVVKTPAPAVLMLKVDELVEGVEVKPTVPPEIAARLDGLVIFDPPTVTLSGPRSALADPANPPQVIAEISEQMLPKAPGTQKIPVVAVRLKDANEQQAIKLNPTTVKAEVKLRSSTTSYTLSTVPVFVMGPPKLMDTYRVVFPNGSSIPRVTVIGPDDEIARIKNNEFIPKAILEIKQEDVRERLPRSPSSFILPPHVTVSDEDKTRTIDFNLVERTRAE